MGGVITGGVTTDASADRTSSYEVVRTLSSDGTWRVTSGTGSSHQEESATTKYDDGTGSVASPSWDTATETLKNSKPLTTRVWFDTTSTIDPATGTWKTTGDGGSESSGVVEITFSGARGYQKDLPVATAMKLVASGTYSQTSKATIDYDYSTKSELVASGVVTTTGKGKASLADSSHTWWTAGTGEGKLTAPDGTRVSHTESGDRNETTKVATDWVFAGGGWQEQQTVLDTSGGSKGSFSSSMNRSWNVAGDPDGDGPGTYSKGSFVTSATDSHDYTSSSKLTRTANATGGFAVTGWRTGGGESHGTSSIDLHSYDTREYLKTADVIANDAYDYTGDTWRADFDAAGMPTVQHSGTLTTKEFYSSAGTDGWSSPPPVVINKQESRPRTELNGAPGFRLSPGRGAFFLGYGNSYDVAGDGYGYDESKAMPGAFGGGQASEATPPETPSGASVVPKGISSEASNYETRLADLSKPRTVTSGSRTLGSGSANLPTMPKVTTPAIGALGFTKSDSAPETPQTRAFASLVTSGMSAAVGAMAETGGSGMLDWIIGDARQVYENTEGMSPLWRGYTVAGFAIADMVGVRQLSDAFSTHDAADGHVQSWQERSMDGAFGAIGLAGTTAVVGRAAIAAANKVDDVGRCMNALTKINLGACFTGDTLVQVTALAGAPSTDPESAAAVATATLQTVAIAMLPLGSRVLAGNPRPEEMDDSFAEPVQATWVTVSVRMTKRDGTVVKAEFLRPRDWVARHGIKAGAALPMVIAELEVEGDAVVTAIGPCPAIADGEGRVVTGRFLTREAGNLVRVALENGTEIRATDVHPVWSMDREEWVPAGELEPGELVDTLAGPVAVLLVERLESALDVYNIEVHGEHVFRVTADGVLVHNACAPLRANMIAEHGAEYMAGKQAAHIIPTNGWSWANRDLHSVIAKVKEAGLIDDVANGFAATAGHNGTHTRAYVNQVIDTMRGLNTREELLGGIGKLRSMIDEGVFQ